MGEDNREEEEQALPNRVTPTIDQPLEGYVLGDEVVFTWDDGMSTTGKVVEITTSTHLD